MKHTILNILSIGLLLFGLLTLFLSASVIFDLFGIREKEGNYVPFVVWSNFVSSLLYLAAGYGLFKVKQWSVWLLVISVFILIAAFIGLKIHINDGGLYEAKTIKAMVFRIGLTILLSVASYFLVKNKQLSKMKRLRFLLPVTVLLLFACNNQESKKEGNHDNHQKSEMKDEQMDNKGEHEETAGKLQLDNGKKWKANPETVTGINRMSSFVLEGILGKIEKAKLHDVLLVEFRTIFDKCTMTGESHNQLHNYLLPLKTKLVQLKAGNAESPEEIQQYLSTFKNYFE